MLITSFLAESKSIDVKCDQFFVTNHSCWFELMNEENRIHIDRADELHFVEPEILPYNAVHRFIIFCDPEIILTEMPTEVFELFPNLKEFNVQCKNITSFTQDDFIHAGNLERFSLPSDQVTQLQSRVFAKMPKLTEIYLQGNQIHTIEDYAFDGLVNLKDLNLHGNKLTKIGKLTFVNLPALDVLLLNENAIAEIEDGAFDLPKLRRLELSENQLKTLSNSLFTHAPALKSLLLDSNQLEHINDALYSLNSLQELRLSHNKMKDFDIKKISKLPNLLLLSLQNIDFNFDAVDVSEDDIKTAKSKVTTLYLKHNKLSSEVIFQKLKIFPGLESVFLSNNLLTKVDLEAINTGGLTHLSEININDNKFDMKWLETKTDELSMTLHTGDNMKITIWHPSF